MIFLVKTIYRHTTNGTSEENKEENTDKWWSVTWLVRKMIKEANFEVINNPKITIKVILSGILLKTLFLIFAAEVCLLCWPGILFCILILF